MTQRLGSPASCTGVLGSTQLAVPSPGQRTPSEAPVLGAVRATHQWKPGWSSGHQASAWPAFGCCVPWHLGHEPAGGSSFCLSNKNEDREGNCYDPAGYRQHKMVLQVQPSHSRPPNSGFPTVHLAPQHVHCGSSSPEVPAARPSVAGGPCTPGGPRCLQSG